MKLLLLTKDVSYYDYKGEVVFVYNKVPYRQPTNNEVKFQLIKQGFIL